MGSYLNSMIGTLEMDIWWVAKVEKNIPRVTNHITKISIPKPWVKVHINFHPKDAKTLGVHQKLMIFETWENPKGGLGLCELHVDWLTNLSFK